MSTTHRHVLALLQTGYTTVRVAFDSPNGTQDAQYDAQPWDAQGVRPAQRQRGTSGLGLPEVEKAYTYKAKLTDNLQVNDRVILDAPRGLAIGTVVQVDSEPVIDLNATFEYKWIVGKVDLDGYRQLMEQEAKFMQLVTEAERVRQREQLLEQFKTTLPQSGEARKLFDEALGLFQSPVIENDSKQS